MSKINRKVLYKLYTSNLHEEKLEEMHIHQHMLYNWALHERIKSYKENDKSLSFSDQCKINTQWRNGRKTHNMFNANAQSEQVTLKRVDLAYQGFFRRVKNGEKAGFPRFKPYNRFSGWGYKSHGDGWKLQLHPKKNMALSD